MASTRSILRAARYSPGGARPTPAPQGAGVGTGSLSPVVMNYAEQHGYANAYSGFLPRPPATFTQGAFGPFSPILPVPVDEPDPFSGRADPRREEYRVGWNLPVGTPGTEGLKLATFSTLRTLADLYSVARACIQLRKSEIRGLEWDIMPTQEAAKANRGDKAWFKDFGERRAKAKKFFRRPDPDYYSWSTFIDAFLEEVFVFDALSLFLRPKRGRGLRKGLLGSDLDSLNLINGPTIRPLYDVQGGFPAPPAPAYQQYLYGVPRSDFTKMLTDMDVADGGLKGSEIAQFRGDQLLYVPMSPRRWTPYGFPPIERAMIPVLSGLQKQGWQLDYFREGTVPAVYMSPGDENMTPNQIRELQDALNAIAGDPAWHHKIIVLPPGTKVEPQRATALADAFDEIVMTQVCMAFDIMPMELGIAPKVSTSMSPGASHQMAKMAENVGERKATKPTLMFIADIINNILEYVCGQDDMQFVFEGLEAEEDQSVLTDLLVKQVENGFRSVDEARDVLNLQPWGLPETSGPVFLSKNGPVPFGMITPGIAPGQSAPAGQQALPGAQLQLPAGGVGGQGDVTSQGAPPSPHPETPGHAAATGARQAPSRATVSSKPTSPATKPTVAPAAKADAAALAKAASSELEALSRHVKKGRQVSSWVPRNVNPDALARISQHLAEGLEIDDAIRVVKATRRVVSLNGQESWVDAVVPFDAAGGGGRSPVRHLGDGTEVPGGVPDATAGGEPPRWASQPPNGYMGGFYDGSDRSQAHHPLGGHDDQVPLTEGHQTDVNARPTGFWPQGGHGTAQAGGAAVPGDANDRGRAPSVGDLGKRQRVTKASVNYRPSTSARSCGSCVMFRPISATCDLVAGPIRSTDVCDRWTQRSATKGACVAASLAVRAADTGRVLMLQRALNPTTCTCGTSIEWDESNGWQHGDGSISHDDGTSVSDRVGTTHDPVAGTWEFPGGRLEPGEQPRSAAVREWQEETGCVLPTGRFLPGWGTESGRWLGFVYEVASEADVPIFTDRDRVTNPDDPDGDRVEAVAWWDVNHLTDNPSVRAELQDDPVLVRNALTRQAPSWDQPVDPQVVADLMARNFRPEGYTWVHEATWTGPRPVNVSEIDFGSEPHWAAAHEHAGVERFVDRLRNGETLRPVILVDTPGDPKLKAVDGHHRVLAYQRLNRPVIAYVGCVPRVVGPWDEAHLYQIHDGDHPGNKTTS